MEAGSDSYLLFAICGTNGDNLGKLAGERFGEADIGGAARGVWDRVTNVADFRKLLVWQKANKLSVATAEVVEGLRGNAASILRGQLLRSTFSIQANIAEGSSKRSDREFARYVRIALGSSTESANHLILLRDLGVLDASSFTALDSSLGEVGRMLSGLEKRLRQPSDKCSAP